MDKDDQPFLAGLNDETRSSGSWSMTKEETEFIREYFKTIREMKENK